MSSVTESVAEFARSRNPVAHAGLKDSEMTKRSTRTQAEGRDRRRRLRASLKTQCVHRGVFCCDRALPRTSRALGNSSSIRSSSKSAESQDRKGRDRGRGTSELRVKKAGTEMTALVTHAVVDGLLL